MLFVALATDYDGTLALNGRTDDATVAALKRLKSAGKRLLMVTGREIPSIKEAFGDLHLFDLVVAENGAVLYFPDTREERPIAAAPSDAFIAALRAKGIAPLSVGHSIVATWTPHETAVLETIRELGLDWQVIFNKGAVMCLPPGVNKATGLMQALSELKLSPCNSVGIGDAENDQAFLAACGCSVAVANAIEPVKQAADIVTRSDHGGGVAELIERWLVSPESLFTAIRRHDLYIGDALPDNSRAVLAPEDGAILIAGSSGAGKSRLSTLLVERLVEARYQVAIVDPEGDYDEFEDFTHLGDTKRTPAPDEACDALNSPNVNVAVNLLGTDIAQRADYFNALLGLLSGLYAKTGRPQWLILDEAHHLCPRSETRLRLSTDGPSMIFVTTKPENLSRSALDAIRTVIAVGEHASEVIASFCRLLDCVAPAALPPPQDDQVVLWPRGKAARIISIAKSKHQHKRHTRKYAEGRLGADISFYFRGPDGTLNLRAYNLGTFIEMANGVDDATWTFHFKRGDYVRWFRDIIKNEDLAAEVESLDHHLNPAAGRLAVVEAIKKRYAVLPPD